MRIIKDLSVGNNINPLTINFLLEKDEYKPYARKVLMLNNDAYIGRRIFNIDVVDKSEFASLPLDGANVVVRLASDPDEGVSFAVATFDFSLPKKTLLPTLKEFVIDLYNTDLSLAQEALNKYKAQGDAEGCETFSKLIELLSLTKPRDNNLIPHVICNAIDPKIQYCQGWPSEKASQDNEERLYARHLLSGQTEEERRIRQVTRQIHERIKTKRYDVQKEVRNLLKLLFESYGLKSPWEKVSDEKGNELSPDVIEEPVLPPRDDVPDSGDYLIEIVPYKYNYVDTTCDFYMQVNGTGKVLKVKTGLGAFVYALCLALRKQNGVLRRETLIKELPINSNEWSPEQKWMGSLYQILFRKSEVVDFRSWWKKQIGCDGPGYPGLTNAITQLKRKINDLFPDESVAYFTIHTMKDKADKRKVAYYWVDMPEENIIFEGSKFNTLIQNIPESMLESPQEGIAE